MFRKSAKNNESGVALLFALGILSLLLILGLAFASNALLSQKVAANNSNRSQAKLLAQSAISRIATAIMYYQYEASKSGIIPLNYSDIYSYGKDKNGTIFADGLFSTDDSLLMPPSSATIDLPDASTLQNPKWAFVFDKPESESDRKIIGRIAYQQVSSKGSSKINLNYVLHGKDHQESHSQESHSEITPPNQKPWENRWGKSIDELNLNSSTPLANWMTEETDETSNYTDLTAFFSAYDSTGQYFYDYTTEGTQGYKNKSFIERWFTPGDTGNEPEYYRYDITSTEYKLYHRFNLGELDDCSLGDEEWYDRFRNDTSVTLSKNSDAILDKLAHDGVEFKLTDELTPADTGIPFLKQITNEHEHKQGTFSTLEARRKQIAANLNDYCDSDSKPTSDVDATNWSVEEGVTEPTFTGNERTPYIYELGYKLEIYHQADGATKTKGFEVDVTNKKLGFQLALFPAVKLAQIYENVPDDFQKFIFKNSVKEISLRGEIIEAKYNDIKYKYKNGDNEVEALASGTIEVAKFADKKITFEPKWNITPTGTEELLLNKPNDADNNISFDLPLTGYPFGEAKDSNNWHGKKYQTYVIGLFDEEILKQVVKSTTPHDPTTIVSGPTSVEITKVNVSEVTVKRGALLLQGQLKDTSSPFGVDFVRAPQKEENSLKFNPTDSSLSLSLSQAEDFTFLLGGIRGMDPRQNLNEDDWFVAARITQGDSKWEKVMCVSSNASGAITGEANKEQDSEADPAHPFDPGEATDTSKYDIEKKAANHGPAWTETNHLSTAYIRNAPMQSLWELGVIHRGAAWQTLNLKAAGAPGGVGSISPSDMKQGLSWDNSSGTSYEQGDGGILEQVKLTEKAYSYGLVNINMLCSDTSINKGYQREYDDQMGEALFYNILYGQKISDFETSTTGTRLTSTSEVVSALKSPTNRPFASRTQFLDWEHSTGSLSNAFGLVDMTNASDAQQEEIVGKTINLLKAEQSASNVIQFIVVVQTIRDVAGTGITKINPENNTAVSRDCQYGVFDAHRYKNGSTVTTDTSNIGDDTNTSDQSPDDYLYFDEITGEVKMLVTLEKVSEVTGQIVVTSIEYLD